MKGRDLGVMNMWYVCRFSCLFTFYEYKQTNVNKSQFSEFIAKPYEYGYQMKAHDEMITNMMFHLLYCLCFSDVNKWHRFLYILKKKVKVYQYGGKTIAPRGTIKNVIKS